MKIQLALDRLTSEECFRIVDSTLKSIDWIEIGTGVIKEYGMSIVREMRKKYPNKVILADMKTCDAGKHEAIQAFEAGADIITVMAFSSNQTIRETLSTAERFNKRVMIDLLGIDSKKRVEEIIELGANLLCLHKGKDMQENGDIASSELFRLVDGISGIELAIAGGINAETAKTFKDSPIDILIVGSAITASHRPDLASKEIQEIF